MNHNNPRSKRSAIARTMRVIAAVGSVAFAGACSSDVLTAPSVPTSYQTVKLSIGGVLKTLIPMAPLTRDVALATPITRSFTIGRDGGKIEIEETGLRIDVPAGAIAGGPLTITVTALPGAGIAYDFQPHGTVFLKPLVFQQDLNDTSWDKTGFKGTLFGGYFADASQLNALSGGLALLDELLPVTLKSNRASFDIRHFSGYMVSGGRQSAYSDSDF